MSPAIIPAPLVPNIPSVLHAIIPPIGLTLKLHLHVFVKTAIMTMVNPCSVLLAILLASHVNLIPCVSLVT